MVIFREHYATQFQDQFHPIRILHKGVNSPTSMQLLKLLIFLKIYITLQYYINILVALIHNIVHLYFVFS